MLKFYKERKMFKLTLKAKKTLGHILGGHAFGIGGGMGGVLGIT